MKRIFVLFGLALLFSSCKFDIITSLNPICASEDAVFDNALIGTWQGNKLTYTFRREGEKSYKLEFTDDENKTNGFSVNLCKIGKDLVMDIGPGELPDEAGKKISIFYAVHIFPVHSFYRVRRDGDKLGLDGMHSDTLLKESRNSVLAIAKVKIDDNNFQYVITADTPTIRKYVAENLKSLFPERRGDGLPLKRIKGNTR